MAERRAKCKGKCEYDGRVSMAFFQGHYYLYARANMRDGGGRYVTVARSKSDSLKDGG